MIRTAIAATVLAVALTGAAPLAQDHSDRALGEALAGLTAGAAQECIHPERITDIRTFENSILYVEGRNKVWRSDTTPGCHALAMGDPITTRGTGSRYCAGDLVQTHAAVGGQLTGTCTLGKFVPYSK